MTETSLNKFGTMGLSLFTYALSKRQKENVRNGVWFASMHKQNPQDLGAWTNDVVFFYPDIIK